MSRNLCRTDCAQCDGRVVHDEEPRLFSERESIAVNLLQEYRGKELHVARAHCEDCGTKYVAWVSWFPYRDEHHRGADLDIHRSPYGEVPHVDLSYQTKFDDYPEDSDLGIDPHVAIAMRAHRNVTDRATYEQCIEVAEAWMQQADKLRKATS